LKKNDKNFVLNEMTKFKILIEKTLKLTGISSNSIKRILNDDKIIFNSQEITALELYTLAFTAPCHDEINNYEFLELLGDSVINTSIVKHFTNRFPELQCPTGVRTIARLKIKYVSKDTFYKFAEQLGFWPFINASAETRERRKKPTLEDVFEAFCGATEWLINQKIGNHVGYHVVQKFIDHLFDQLDISLEHTSLYDAITRLKETQDYHLSKQGRGQWNLKHGSEFGRIKYESKRVMNETTGYSRQHVTIRRVVVQNDLYNEINNKLPSQFRSRFWHSLKSEQILAIKNCKMQYQIGGVLAQASAPLLPDAKQNAAEIALKTLHSMGLTHKPTKS
jgi:dsRNA-specific ribonuclease